MTPATKTQTRPSLIDAGGPVVAGIYDQLIAAAEKVGAFEVQEKKTCLHLANGSAFAGVHPRKNGLLLNLRTKSRIDSPRVRKSEQVSSNRCHNEVVLSSAADVDAELRGWLRDAYDVSAVPSDDRSS